MWYLTLVVSGKMPFSRSLFHPLFGHRIFQDGPHLAYAISVTIVVGRLVCCAHAQWHLSHVHGVAMMSDAATPGICTKWGIIHSSPSLSAGYMEGKVEGGFLSRLPSNPLPQSITGAFLHFGSHRILCLLLSWAKRHSQDRNALFQPIRFFLLSIIFSGPLTWYIPQHLALLGLAPFNLGAPSICLVSSPFFHPLHPSHQSELLQSSLWM